MRERAATFLICAASLSIAQPMARASALAAQTSTAQKTSLGGADRARQALNRLTFGAPGASAG